MSDNIYEQVLHEFEQAGASMRCASVKALLMDLHFEVKDGRRGGHKVYTHNHIQGFTSAAYNCGHKSNSEVNRVYIKNIIKIIKTYEDELKTHLGIHK